MRTIILLATVVALASGLLGALAYNQLFGEAGAAPPTVPREGEITLTAWGFHNFIEGPSEYPGTLVITHNLVTIDPSDYPPGTAFRFRVAGWLDLPGTVCHRLTEVAGFTTATPDFRPIPSSDVCHTATRENEIFAVESPAFALPAGTRIYTFQEKATTTNTLRSFTLRVVARWEERAVP